MQRTRETATKLGIITLLVLSWTAQAGATPITSFNEAYHFRSNIGPNSVGLPPGDQQYVVVLDVAPTAGTVVTARQGAVTRDIPFTPLTLFPTAFRSLEPFDLSLTGSWFITATNGPDVAQLPLFTPPIANPQLLPFIENLQIVGAGATPTVMWSLPDLTGFEVDSLGFRVYDDANDDILYQTGLPLTTNAFTIPGGLLDPGVPYVFSVSLGDTRPGGGTENNSTVFTQSAFYVPEPGVAVLLGLGLAGLGGSRRRPSA